MFYHEIRPILDKFMRNNSLLTYTLYSDFYELEVIGSGGHRTVYTAKYKKYSRIMPQTVVLKRFKSFDKTPELFISEVSSN